ncbi:inhibin beta B chain-like [Seriola lalandi dorsalis]|uniref:Inhibin subunit beta C n=2 Tax=Seriola TaxID=8160 RepID=A0A3B4V7C3_SERDU|nr:inhibin beta B chain-like [Seriola dumerili]XP_023268606.1 inhibin beta B chain-like [Seriola lalandi dorsalis]XP_056251834.1 inhibin beta B chain [Seriola aureovittata]
MTPSFLFPSLLFLVSLLLKGLWVSGSPGCASCGLPAMEKDAEERLMIEIAKQQILEKLHLKERPNITHTVPRAALLTALRKLHSGRVRQDGTLELENNVPTKEQGYEIVSFADISETGNGEEASLSLTFQFLQERGQSIQVLQSSLWIYARSSEDPHRDSRLPARVFLSADDGVSGTNRTLVMEKMLEVQESNWHTFPITRILQAFLDGGKRRLRLEVSCDEDGKNLCSLDGSADTPYQPFLVAQVRLRDDHSKHLLRKRSLRCGDDVTVCCKKDFYIKFKDIQWDEWIIAPEGYHMNYCIGQCPQHLSGSPGIASSFHATVFSQLKINGINTATTSCCVPTERRPLSMVFFDSQHSIVKMDVPDMIVESCGCT